MDIIKFLKKHYIRLISLVTGLFGLWLVLSSTYLGREAANKLLSKAGGMNTDKYLLLMENFIMDFRVAGGILLGVGLFCVLRRKY